MEHESTPDVDMETTATEGLAEGSSKPCHLLDKMPGELRNKIWSFALDYSAGVVMDCGTGKLITKEPLAVTMTCKQIRHECEPFLFTQRESWVIPSQKDEAEHLIKNHAAIIAKFRGMHLALGRHDCVNFTSVTDPMEKAFRACKRSGTLLLVSFEMTFFGQHVPYSIAMQDKEEALADVQGSAKTAEACGGYALPGSCRLLMEWVENCFDREELYEVRCKLRAQRREVQALLKKTDP